MHVPVYLDYNATTQVAPEVDRGGSSMSSASIATVWLIPRMCAGLCETMRRCRTHEALSAVRGVLGATGVDAQRAMGAVRFAVGADTTAQEIERAVAALVQARCH